MFGLQRMRIGKDLQEQEGKERNLARELLGNNHRDNNQPRNMGNEKNLDCFRNEGRNFACAEEGVLERSWVGWGSRQRCGVPVCGGRGTKVCSVSRGG